MISAASRASPDAATEAEAGSDYFAAEAHYLSLAGRIVSALRAGGSLVLVTGDPPAGRHPLSQALRKAAESRHTVIDSPYGPDLTFHELCRAGSVVATLPASAGATAASETSEPAPPLFVFDDVDQLSEQQIREIFELTRAAAAKGTAGVLLARPVFLARLEEPPLRFLKDALAAQFGFQEVGQDESIEFLRHQLAARHRRTESRGIPPGVFRGLAAFGVLLAVGIGAFLFLQYFNLAGAPLERSATGPTSPREASTPRSAPSETPAKAAPPAERAPIVSSVPPIAGTSQPLRVPQAALPGTGLAPARDPAAPRAISPAATPEPAQPARVPDAAPPAAALAPTRDPTKQKPVSPPATPPGVAAPAAEQEHTTPQATSRAASPAPTESPASQRLSAAETAALVTRGDRFLSSGDIASARLYYERAADAGDGSAALRLGTTFDPGFLGRAGIRGAAGDLAQASSWYRRARELGNAAAEERLKKLEQQPPAEPNPPAQ